MNTLFRLHNVNKFYHMGQERLHALKDICLHVDEGEYLTVLGPSGSGKTTLMNILGCIDRADGGEYHLQNIAVHACNDQQMAGVRNQKIGFIFQKYHLIPQYTALQNIIMPLLLRGATRSEALEQAKHYIGMMGLTDRIGHKPNELSGGQQQRVAIARALVTRPALLLADEPTGALDSETGREILMLFKELHRSGSSIVVISHDSKVAKQSDRVVHIVDGTLLEQAA